MYGGTLYWRQEQTSSRDPCKWKEKDLKTDGEDKESESIPEEYKDENHGFNLYFESKARETEARLKQIVPAADKVALANRKADQEDRRLALEERRLALEEKRMMLDNQKIN